MARWAVRELANIPVVADGEPGDPAWHPLQHYFGLSTFGANVFGASGQEELYLVMEGEATFELDGETVLATKGAVVAIPTPSVTRRAVALQRGTTLLAIGAPPGAFTTTWNPTHFEGVPRAT